MLQQVIHFALTAFIKSFTYQDYLIIIKKTAFKCFETSHHISSRIRMPIFILMVAKTSNNDINSLRTNAHYLEVINLFASELLKARTIDEVVWTVAKHAIAKLGFIDCVVYLLDDDNEFLSQRAAHGPKNPIDLDIKNPIKLKIGQGIVGNVVLTGVPEIVPDTSICERYVIDDTAGMSEISVPIISEGKVLGVIDSEHPDKNYYTQEDLRILTTIASMTSFKLVQARVQQELLQHRDHLENLVEIQTKELRSTINLLQHNNFEKEDLLNEITDSITYAKNIQTAILPSKKIVQKLLRESFIYYKPKDIVAGDFYWLQERDNKVLFAVADCTGHGVPGAMVSVVCNNALNRSVREYGLTEPGKILDKTRGIVKEEFEKSGKEVNDGMDIALCSLEGNQLEYAGARIPVWIIRDGEIIEIKGDRQPIGKYGSQKPYTTHTFNLQEGDLIYIFSDGFVDQFGGEKGKKFKIQPFRDLLLSIQENNMYDQKTIIYKTFEDWKGTLEQIDDISVIGVRI